MFLTGDLARLDGLVFDEPIYGVWCDEPGYYEYNWMGRFKTDEERTLQYEDEDYPYTADMMGRSRLDDAWELAVMDWLYSASEEELPEEQKELAEIGRELRAIREENSEEAEKQFLEIFVVGGIKKESLIGIVRGQFKRTCAWRALWISGE